MLASVKRAPKWAWITAAGVGIAAGGIQLWKHRATDATDDIVAADGSTAADPLNPYGLPTSTGNPVATIVPPVIIGGNNDADQGVGVLQDLYVGAVGGVIQAYQDVWGPVQTAQLALLTGNAQTIQDLAIAGSAPNSSGSTPAALLPYTPPAPAAPQALPSKPKDPCTGEFPFQSSQGCYKVVCASGKGDHAKGRWHFYKGGREVRVAATC